VESGISVNLVRQDLQENVGVPSERMVSSNENEETWKDKQLILGLGIRLQSLYSFFNLRNHPLADAEAAKDSPRDFLNETRIARALLLHNARLSNSLARGGNYLEDGIDDIAILSGAISAQSNSLLGSINNIDNSLIALAESFVDMSQVISTMLNASSIDRRTYMSMGKIITSMLDHSKAVRMLIGSVNQHVTSNLQPPLVQLSYSVKPETLASGLLHIFVGIARCLNYLRLIEDDLRSDRPLKESLSLFTLVHEEARSLLSFVESQLTKIEGIEESVFNALDGMVYAISMELRKVFKYELLSLSSLRNASQLYAKVENSHGLLRDCFQQSTLALAHVFNPDIDGTEIFSVFQTRLEQSVTLCKDLWFLKQLVKKEEKDEGRRSVASLIEKLRAFRDGSMRYLMYKDWEAYERFVEELATARGETEIKPQLHRLGCYLETLFGQIRMRAVLANYPLELEEIDQ
jgi:hypothetical protein